jgi:putative transposase
VDEIACLHLDARYEKVREDAQIRDAAVSIATGVDMHGRRQISGLSVSLSEAEILWRGFLKGLVAHGLSGIQLVTSDDCAGLGATRRATHFCRNCQPGLLVGGREAR